MIHNTSREPEAHSSQQDTLGDAHSRGSGRRAAAGIPRYSAVQSGFPAINILGRCLFFPLYPLTPASTHLFAVSMLEPFQKATLLESHCVCLWPFRLASSTHFTLNMHLLLLHAFSWIGSSLLFST